MTDAERQSALIRLQQVLTARAATSEIPRQYSDVIISRNAFSFFGYWRMIDCLENGLVDVTCRWRIRSEIRRYQWQQFSTMGASIKFNYFSKILKNQVKNETKVEIQRRFFSVFSFARCRRKSSSSLSSLLIIKIFFFPTKFLYADSNIDKFCTKLDFRIWKTFCRSLQIFTWVLIDVEPKKSDSKVWRFSSLQIIIVKRLRFTNSRWTSRIEKKKKKTFFFSSRRIFRLIDYEIECRNRKISSFWIIRRVKHLKSSIGKNLVRNLRNKR